MAHLNTPDYYRRRETQERALASNAASPDISRIHQEMADHYAELQAQGRPARATLRLFTR